MKETMSKWRVFWAWDYDKEEAWLNEMSHQGWQLQSAEMIHYTFIKGEPDEYNYRLEFLDKNKTKQERQAYLDFMKEIGIDGISRYGYWIYFRKKNDGEPFEIYSDGPSKIQHIKRILWLMVVVCICLSTSLVSSLNMWHSTTLTAKSAPPMILVTVIAVTLLGHVIYGFIKMSRMKKELEQKE